MCSEVYVPEVARALALQGAELIFIPAGDDKHRLWETWRTLIWARAIENLAVVATTQNVYGEERGLAMVATPEEIVLEETAPGAYYVDVDLDAREAAARRCRRAGLAARGQGGPPDAVAAARPLRAARKPLATRPFPSVGVRARLSETAPGYSLPRGRVLAIYGGLSIALLLSAVDQTIVSTVLPEIVSDIGGIDQYSWTFTAYLLTATVTIPLYGKLGDVYGRRPLFVFAILTFIVSSVLCGLSQTMPELIVSRGLQGVGAGALFPLALATVGEIVPIRERGRYQGLLGAGFAGGAILGPLAGGFIVDNASWRWVFLINVPLGAGLARSCSLVTMPAGQREGRAAESTTPARPCSPRRPPACCSVSNGAGRAYRLAVARGARRLRSVRRPHGGARRRRGARGRADPAVPPRPHRARSRRAWSRSLSPRWPCTA